MFCLVATITYLYGFGDMAVREGGGFLSKINRNEVLPLTIPKTECVIPICK